MGESYIDICSGEFADGREQYMRMLRDCADHKIDVILTKSISRFGRDAEETIAALRELKQCGTQVIFELENIDSNDADSELLASIIAGVADAENESRRTNQLWGIRKRLKDGTSEIYKRKCYGYRKNEDDELVIDYRQAEAVQLIFTEYLNGASIIGIRKLLKEKGILSPQGKEEWSKSSIEHILDNEKYTGDVIALKTYIQNHRKVRNTDQDKYMISDFVPSIISREMFEAVQKEKLRRSNVETDESGTHRKNSHYSSKKK